MKLYSLLSLLLAVAACSTPGAQETGHVEFDAAHALNVICENIASDYRLDREANPDLCVGYDENGWPIDSAEIKLPDNW
ncbi:hypothetical protein [Ruegeria atlantica]|uniref:hypothetical protein n=1 Tax=Ruegeria atlantica TaxID=81569 RepID=UPI001C2BDD3D|nr:hypothetical protein [Ruegeria atlantica]